MGNQHIQLFKSTYDNNICSHHNFETPELIN
jgi:hypothetical protein